MGKKREHEEAPVGLECVSDETLEVILRSQVDHDGQLLHPETQIAFLELARRSGYHVRK